MLKKHMTHLAQLMISVWVMTLMCSKSIQQAIKISVPTDIYSDTEHSIYLIKLK